MLIKSVHYEISRLSVATGLSSQFGLCVDCGDINNSFHLAMFRGRPNTFYESIWLFSKLSFVLGSFPLVTTSDSSGIIQVKTTRFSVAYYVICIVGAFTFVIYSHLHMNHVHHQNPVIFHVVYFQTVVIALAGAFGCLNTLITRGTLVEVSLISK
jgi:uncharacterized protein with PQ loop repeat